MRNQASGITHLECSLLWSLAAKKSKATDDNFSYIYLQHRLPLPPHKAPSYCHSESRRRRWQWPHPLAAIGCHRPRSSTTAAATGDDAETSALTADERIHRARRRMTNKGGSFNPAVRFHRCDSMTAPQIELVDRGIVTAVGLLSSLIPRNRRAARRKRSA